MLASSATRDTDEFLHSLAFLWAQLKNDKLPLEKSGELQKALDVTTKYYATDKSFDQPKQIKNLVISVLTNLQLTYTLTETQTQDRDYTLHLSLSNLPQNRFSMIVGSLFDAIQKQAPSQFLWKMGHIPPTLSQSKCHQLHFVRHD